eukprot:TRINITY_DN7976_c0_g1_i1.p1 TRINITY_DN7976_c0_g1~~TRINITY_DN7976_c0_g1_i1.p1  ORF type:complete len:267 (+),score=35.49 TRINITY_DN7976_c0_g1_i1:240-1040(+)
MESHFIPAEDGSLPCKPEEVEEVLNYRRKFELDQYYASIADLTFTTEFLCFTLEEAQVFAKISRGTSCSSSENKLISNLKKRLTSCISNYKDGAFVRLSTRSPKDAVDKYPALLHPILQVTLKEQAEIDNVKIQDLEENSKLIAIRRAFFRIMKVSNAEEIFNLMMYSARIISDLKRALDYKDLKTLDWNLKFIIREFVDIPIEYELRAFVYKNQLVALTQYYADTFFQDLWDNQETIKQCVQDFFYEQVQSRCTDLQSYLSLIHI